MSIFVYSPHFRLLHYYNISVDLLLRCSLKFVVSAFFSSLSSIAPNIIRIWHKPHLTCTRNNDDDDDVQRTLMNDHTPLHLSYKHHRSTANSRISSVITCMVAERLSTVTGDNNFYKQWNRTETNEKAKTFLNKTKFELNTRVNKRYARKNAAYKLQREKSFKKEKKNRRIARESQIRIFPVCELWCYCACAIDTIKYVVDFFPLKTDFLCRFQQLGTVEEYVRVFDSCRWKFPCNRSTLRLREKWNRRRSYSHIVECVCEQSAVVVVFFVCVLFPSIV